MFSDLFVIACVLIHGATYSLGFECSKYYFLLQGYTDPDFNSTFVDPVSEKIHWENYTISTNVSGLKDFNPNCVLYLGCHTEVHCVDNITPVILHGPDERIADKTHEKIKFTDTSDILNANKTSLSNVTDDTLHNSTKNPTTTNTTEGIDKAVASKNESLKDSITGVIKKNGSTLHVTKNNITEAAIIGIYDSDDGYLSFEESIRITNTTTNTTEGIDNTTTTSSHAKNDKERIGKPAHVSKNTTDEKPQDSKAVAGKIAIGVLATGAFVASILLAKNHIIGCLQSGVYHIPEA